METKELLAEFKSTWEVMKVALDEAKAEAKRAGTSTAETEQKITRIEARMDELEVKLQRPITGGMGLDGTSEQKAMEAKARKDLYFKVLRQGSFALLDDDERAKAREWGIKQVGAQDVKALSLADDTTGGFLAPPEFVQDIIKGVQLISPIRSIANVRSTSRRSINYPVRSGVFAASWIGETATRTETQGLTYSMEEIPTYEMYAEVIVSEQDLEDSAFDLEAEIRDNAAEQLAKAEGAAFVAGTSVKQPEGFMNNDAVLYDFSGTDGKIASPFSAGVTAQGDGLVKAAYNLKTAYASGATWVMNRKSVGVVRRLQDGQGRYIWEPAYDSGGRANILGIPVLETPDMADEATGGASFPVAIGNFRRGYVIVDRVDMVVKRLNEKYAEQGQIAFIVRKRVGGQVVLPEAIRKYKAYTS